MTNKPSYLDLLRDARWQEKRLRLLDAAGFECQDCGKGKDDGISLEIHHTYYERGLNPWDYPNESLWVLCSACHRKAQNVMTLTKRQMGKLSQSDHERLLGYAMGLGAAEIPYTVISVLSYEMAAGVGDVWNVSADAIIGALVEGQIDGFKLFELEHGKKFEFPE